MIRNDNSQTKNQTEAAYVLVIHWDNSDPSTYGPFENEKAAEAYRDQLTAQWDDSDWDAAGNGHGISISKLNK